MPGLQRNALHDSELSAVAASTSPLNGIGQVIPFHLFLLKIASRCNLNCTYCYIYNRADQRWRNQPHFMSEETARQAARRIREHLLAHDKKDVSIVFHGGEPLLGGVEHLQMLIGVVEEELRQKDIKCSIGMQSNALLFTEEIGDLMLKHRVGIGVSIDGPPEWNDVFRLDHLGRPTGHLLAEPLKLLLSEKYRKIFSGVLCVINIDVDPVAIFDYFESLGIRNMDFLLPLDNHDRPPKGKEVPEASPYGDWLIRLFDRWWDAGATADIRTFSAILKGIANLPSGVESIGLSPADLVVVETNGAIEGVDSLKAAADGATDIGLDIFSHGFEEAAKHHAVQIRQSGTTQLCSTCKQCPVVRVCGGGYYPHRYSKINGFENPSVYCSDLQKIIRHIHTRLVKDLASLTPQEKSA